jgi:trimethylamine---corrinoid protein Co-methyltransferase
MKCAITQIYSDEKMERLYRGALRVLQETGVFIDHDLFLDEFGKRGMRVDRTKRRVFITEELIKDLLRPEPDRYRNADFFETIPAGFGVGGSYPKYYDWTSRKSCRGSSEILRELVRVFGSMEEFGCAGRILTLCDVPQRIEPIMATALVLKHSPKPSGGEVYEADNIPYLIELGEIATGRAGCIDYVPSCTFMVPPLKMTREEGEMVLAKARYHIPAIAGSMPSSGATSPVTREGTVVIELAEIFTIWLCYRLIEPEIEIGTISASSILDMREGTCSFSAPEAIIQDCAASQICRQYFGAAARMSSAYVDAKTPGIQTTYEKLFKAWWSHQFLGFAPYGGGLLEAGQTFSPAQALLDWDIWKSHNALFKKEIPVDEEIPFEDIQQVATAQGTFLDTDHTMRLFREVLRHPLFLDRSARRSDAEEAEKSDGLLDRAQGRYEEMKRTAPEFTASDEICRAVDKVVDRAKKNLL